MTFRSRKYQSVGLVTSHDNTFHSFIPSLYSLSDSLLLPNLKRFTVLDSPHHLNLSSSLPFSGSISSKTSHHRYYAPFGPGRYILLFSCLHPQHAIPAPQVLVTPEPNDKSVAQRVPQLFNTDVTVIPKHPLPLNPNPHPRLQSLQHPQPQCRNPPPKTSKSPPQT